MRRLKLVGVMFALSVMITLMLTLRVSATTGGEPFYVDGPAMNPDIAIDSSGGLHIVWLNPKQHRIEYRFCSDSNTCSPAEELPALAGNASSPAIALDSSDRPHIVWEQHRNKKKSIIFYSRRTNGVWTQPDRISKGAHSFGPDIAVGDDGVKHIVFENLGATARRIYHSTRGGSSNTIQLLESEKERSPDRIANGRSVRVAVDNSNLAHIVWNTAGNPSKIKYTFESKPGIFVAPLVVSGAERARSPDLAIDPETDSVGIVWETPGDSRASFALYRDGAPVFQQSDIIGISKLVRNPRIAADCGQRFHIVFQGQELIQTDWDIYHRVFNPAIQSFTPTELVTDSTTDDITPATATTDMLAFAYGIEDNESVQALFGASPLSCAAEPTPTPTATPTVPADTWEHIPNDDARINYSKGWKTQTAKQASEGNYARCQKDGMCQDNASAKLVFTGGKRIEWVTAYANNYGKADVYLDGKPFEVVDLCSPNRNSTKPKFGTRTYILSGNDSTEHSIKIVAVGHTGCSDVNKNYVAVDGFNILR